MLARWLKGILIASIALLAVAVSALVVMNTPVDPTDPGRPFVISQGDSAFSIARKLDRQRFIRSAYYFLLLTTTGDRNKDIKAGRYEISGSMTTRAIVDHLVERAPLPRTYRITIPEGFTAAETASRFEQAGLCGADDFMRLVRNPSSYSINTHGMDIENLEGYLFPETYFFDNRSTCASVVQRMVDQFFKLFNSRYVERSEDIGMTLNQVVTLASLVEKEARIDSERKLISGVLHNRLDKNMLLQVDATIQYALPKRKTRIYYKDLEIDSPYNTYKKPGLPPGPICSPGWNSIVAAMYPEETQYYYYVAAGDGSHVFSRSNAEHIRAKQKVRSNNR